MLSDEVLLDVFVLVENTMVTLTISGVLFRSDVGPDSAPPSVLDISC